jgi:type IV pilus assembly protein PilB
MAEDILSPLLSLIKEQGLIDDLQYEDVVAEIKRSNAPAIQVLQDFGIMKLDDILHVEATYLGTEVVSLQNREISAELLKTIPVTAARMYRCIPVALNGDILQVALAEPLDPARADEIHFSAKRDIQVVVADPAEIDKTIERLYGQDESANYAEILKEIGAGKDFAREADEAADNEKLMADLANDVPIVKFVNLVLQQAVQDRASDIHFEPFETEFRIRYRVDGALYEMAPPPKHLALPVISRLKIMANLNISERRMPQDGRITHQTNGKQVDLRMSTLPTQFGESVVLRVLDRSSVNLELEALGLPKMVYDFVSEVILRPNGIFVVTGPTGSGKTTTLYSCLRRVNTIDSKLLTAEDPVEFDIEGIMQVAINEGVGMTFGKALRSFLRQDPDIIMVG